MGMLEGKEKKGKEQEDKQREEGIEGGLTEEMDADLNINCAILNGINKTHWLV